MEIKMTKIITDKKEALKAIDQLFFVVNETLEPGWNADLTVSLSCRGSKYRTDHPKDHKIE